ncbi:hypothetical protein GCK72_003323 [Caenorhabditis remanei]|uniref:Tyrosine-protein phosphatase domain-containing protein n=1 Tax=Caenorhabditis remanei TaxID=31234 RepID=A0A6A5HX15_CAERE|nr:hypothetical protein GCK72_003323 [Caenorhabditis remanei]KAF1771496.1 hypothetical protein GCK72_003323 [Caenorhabditis remanei]
MKLLLLVLLVATTQPLPIRSKDSEDAFYPVRHVYRNANDSNLRAYRSPGDKLKSSLEHLKMIARVTNGIYLQHALASGSIPADKLISELLHFGNVTITQIAGIEMSKVQKSVEMLKALPGSLLNPNPDVADIELTLGTIQEILGAIDGLGDVGMRPRAKEFDAFMTTLSKTDVVIQVVADFERKMHSWNGAHQEIKTVTAINRAQISFEDIFHVANITKTCLPSLQSTLPLWKYKEFKSAAEGLEPSMRLVDAINITDENILNLVRTTKQWTPYSEYLNGVLSQLNTMRSSYSEFQNVYDLLMARKSPRSRLVEHAAGFSDGVSDIVSISVDLADPWMKSVVKSDELTIALNGLKSLEVVAKKIEDSLKSPDLLSDITPLFENLDLLNKFALDTDNIKTGVTQGQTAPAASPFNLESKPVTEANDILEGIDEKFAQLEALVPKLIQAVSVPGLAEMCDAIIKVYETIKDSKDVTAFTKAYTDFKDMSKLKNLVDNIYGIVANITAVQKPRTIKGDAARYVFRTSQLDTYHSTAKTKANIFEHYQNSPGLKSLIKAQSEIERIRKLDQTVLNSFDKGMEVVKTVAGTSDDLKKLRTTIEAVNGVKSKEIDGLEELKEAGRHSKTIGLAVRGISSMKNVLEMKSDVVDLARNIDVIGQYKKDVKDSEDVRDLDSLVKIADATEKMLKSLDTLESTVTISTSTVLADQAAIFEKAKMITGVNGDYKKILASVMRMESESSGMSSQDQFKVNHVKESLEKMDEMDLDFASYQLSFTASKASLVVLDEFFDRYFQRMTGIDSGNKKEVKKDMTLLFVGGGLLGTVLILAIIHLILFKCASDKFFTIYPFLLPQPNWWLPKDTVSYLRIVVTAMHTKIEEYRNNNLQNQKGDFVGQDFYNFFKGSYISYCVAFDEPSGDKLLEIDSQDSRCQEPIIKATMPKLTGYGTRFTNASFDANLFTLPYKKEWYITETPVGSSADKNSTIEKFWWLVMQKKSKMVVMFGLKEKGKDSPPGHLKYFPLKKGEKLELVGLTLECLECQKDKNGLLYRKISGQFGGKKFTVTHYFFYNWEISKTNKDTRDLLIKLLKTALSQKSPLVVHCETGRQQSSTFALAAHLITSVFKLKQFDLKASLLALKSSRYHSVTAPCQFACSSILAMEYFATNLEVKDFNDQKMRSRYVTHQASWVAYDVIFKDDENPHQVDIDDADAKKNEPTPDDKKKPKLKKTEKEPASTISQVNEQNQPAQPEEGGSQQNEAPAENPE